MFVEYDKHRARALRASFRFYRLLRDSGNRQLIDSLVEISPRQFANAFVAANPRAGKYHQAIIEHAKHQFPYVLVRQWEERFHVAADSYPLPH